MEDIYKTRILLESYAIDHLPTPMDQSILSRIATQCDAFSDAISRQDFRRVVAANRLFHHTIFAQCGNLLVLDLIDQLRTRSHFWQHYIVGQPDRINRTISEHQVMLDYLKKGEMAALKHVNQTHLTWGYKDFMTDLRPSPMD
jgi:DNA-binding GntR family transcriptional regulator